MPPQETLFRLGKYWIGRVPGSDRLYRFWYDAGAGEVRRRSLATTVLDEAQIKLASLVLNEGTGSAREPKDVGLYSVLHRYYETHTDHRPNAFAARRHGDLILQFLNDDAAKVAELNRDRQIAFIKNLHTEQGYSVAYIARIQSTISAALNRSVAADDDDTAALLRRAPKIIVQAGMIAEILNAPEPVPRTWHPDLKGLARFFDAIPPEEDTRIRRFALLMLAFAARPEAIRDLTPSQLDERNKLVKLNPDGRRQTKKHRPTLPAPPRLWKAMMGWLDEDTLVHKDGNPVIVLRKPWHAIRERARLPEAFTPYALRHYMATELRRRRVPREQREMWMGHHRVNINDAYGIFEPDYLKDARDAVDSFLKELEKACKVPLFRQVSAKTASGALAADAGK